MCVCKRERKRGGEKERKSGIRRLDGRLLETVASTVRG